MTDEPRRILYYVNNGGVSAFAVERETAKMYFVVKERGMNAFKWAYVPRRISKDDKAVHATLKEALEYMAWQMGCDIDAMKRRMSERQEELEKVMEAIAQCQILNYTTTIDAMKTVNEVLAILGKKGASRVITDYEECMPVAMSFALQVEDRMQHFRIPCRWQNVLVRLKKDPGVPPRLKTKEQALRVAWRILKDWVESQFAIVDGGVVDSAEEVFFAYAIVPNGRTVYEEYAAQFRLEEKGDGRQSM